MALFEETQAPVAARAREAFPRSSFNVVAMQDGIVREESLEVICEHELTLVANGEELATLMCSRANLAELACGFLFSEGIIEGASDILASSVGVSRAIFSLRSLPGARSTVPVVTSGFGGTALIAPSDLSLSLAETAGPSPFPSEGPAVSAEESDGLREAVVAMRVAATEYAATRGTHCSALFRGGELVALFEDIGRHNTFDKLAGWCLLNAVDPAGMLLTTTGRVSSEMMRKACRLGVAGVASLSGPTDMAVRLVRRAGLLLAGYVNSTRLTLYATR